MSATLDTTPGSMSRTRPGLPPSDARVDGPRPISILIAALGGEGGAVLADWIRDAATAGGYPIQSTSIPGVAQRTGATTYYLELYPVRTRDVPSGCEPVLALTPAPDNVDLMVASELVEAGRAMQNGYVTARTTLIAATHRIYATSEKMHGGDGRFDAGRVLAAGPHLAGRAAFIDMAGLAQESRTVVSAVMFGAIAAAEVLPVSREACEAAIQEGGVGVDASLAGFAAGWTAMRSPASAVAASHASLGSESSAPLLPSHYAERIRRELPRESHAIAEAGVRRAIDYQDAAYGTRYLDRVSDIAGRPGATPELVTETARFLALWMCYEDVPRVAELKSRASRFARVRREVGAGEDEPLHIVDFLRPGRDEICDMLPETLARRLRRDGVAAASRTGPGIHLQSTSIAGFATLRALARLAAWRPRSSRFAREQARIDIWLAAIRDALASSRNDVALETALAARLVKGYGDTHARGVTAFLHVTAIANDASIPPDGRAAAMRAAREAALAEPERIADSHAPAAQPVRFIRKNRSTNSR